MRDNKEDILLLHLFGTEIDDAGAFYIEIKDVNVDDVDDDRLADGDEKVIFHTLPKKDTDEDGLTDGEELSSSLDVMDLFTSPREDDTDDDDHDDCIEVEQGWDPLDPSDPDRNDLPDAAVEQLCRNRREQSLSNGG